MSWYAIAAILVTLLLLKPMRPLLKSLIRSALALPAIFIFNFIAGNFGFSLGVNVLNAVLIGFLGIPGALSAVALGILF